MPVQPPHAFPQYGSLPYLIGEMVALSELDQIAIGERETAAR